MRARPLCCTTQRTNLNIKNKQDDIMSRAIRIRKLGGPEVLKLEDIAIGNAGPGEIKLRQHAIGINYLDIYFRTGQYPVPSLPFTPGNEGSGEITAIGRGVKGFEVGERVAYAGSLGGYAEERVIDAKFVVKLPSKISYETGAAMMLKGLTAQYLLRRTFRVKKGDTILVHAAAGGVGLILCQWAASLGVTVIGTTSTEEKAAMAKKAGAKHVILYSSENFAERVKDITKGKLCDVVYDGVGKATFPASLDCIAPLGTFVSYGSASGPIDAFNIALLSQKGSVYATRPTLFTYMAVREDLDKMARELFKVVLAGTVDIPIHATWKLEEASKAHEALESRVTTGTTILIP